MDRLRPAVACFIVGVWATAYLVDIFDEKFSAPPELTPPMLAAATYLFGSDIKRRILDGTGGNNQEDQS